VKDCDKEFWASADDGCEKFRGGSADFVGRVFVVRVAVDDMISQIPRGKVSRDAYTSSSSSSSSSPSASPMSSSPSSPPA
jgi:hypothetical protein